MSYQVFGKKNRKKFEFQIYIFKLVNYLTKKQRV